MFQRKSDGLWVEKIKINGKVKNITSKSKTELKKKLVEIGSQKEKGQPFDSVADLWEDNYASTLAFKTYESYKPHIRRLKDYFTDTPVAEITPAEIQAFVDGLGRKGYAKDTVHRALVICSMIFDYAILLPDSPLRFNPCSAVKVPKGLSKTRREPPSDSQIEKITPNSEMGLFAWFLLCTGLRRGELLALRWEDIDRENKLINVGKAIGYEHNRGIIKSPKTESGIRKVELIHTLEEVLPNKKHGYIFGGNEPWSETKFKKAWVKYCREIGLAEAEETETVGSNGRTYKTTRWKAKVTPHQFRHWYATALEGANVSELSAKNLLGHASITTTKDIYTHIRSLKENRNNEIIDGYIKGTLKR